MESTDNVSSENNQMNVGNRISEEKSEKKVSAIHNFGGKLLQADTIEVLKEYVRWQAVVRNSPEPQALFGAGPDYSPISINLDLTTACNYACDHCVDMSILNTGIRFDYQELENSIDLMWKRGLRSVIIIGGGEPTIDPNFTKMVRFLKERKIQVAVVTNGSGMKKVLEVAHLFDKKDWIRLSLDSGTDATFQAMHKPKRKITLEEICKGVAEVRKINKNLQVGFSYIVTWAGATINDLDIIENIHEIYDAVKLAKDNDFTYVSIKPFLERCFENNAEIVGIDEERNNYIETIKRIRDAVAEAKELETDTFKVVESTNLRALESGTFREYTKQPKHCHFTFFRQVLSPLGTFNCPVYRHVEIAQLGEKNSYSTEEKYKQTKENVGRSIHEFDASENCKKVTCLYNSANWFIEDLIKNPLKLDELEASDVPGDFFL